MGVYMIDSKFAQPQSNIDRLVQAEKISAAPPLIQESDYAGANCPFPFSLSNFIQQFPFFWQVMHSFDNPPVPIL
jgi:hypothetical protein